MNFHRIKNETWLYVLAFGFAFGLRFIQLGASPLTDSEAALSLQALAIARGETHLLAPQPAYILLTSVLFGVIEATNFTARAIPALAGSMLPLVPFFFREKLKPRPALILAFLLAIDPGLTAISRQANGTMLAVTFLLFAAAMWINKRHIAAGIFSGLALLAGPSIWSGVLSLGLTAFFLRGAKPTTSNGNPVSEETPASPSPVFDDRASIRQFILALLVAFALAGTLFLLVPNGLSAALASIPAYFTGWFAMPTATPDRLLVTFILYESLGIFLALFAIIRGVRARSLRFLRLIVWWTIALLIAVLYRQPDGLVWAILPLLALGALELSRAFDIHPDERVEVGVVVTAMMILLAYVWLNVANYALNPYSQLPAVIPILGEVQNPRTLVVYGSFSIVVICITLVAFGWSARIARLGAIWSFTAFLGLYAIAAAWGASGLRNPNGFELWSGDAQPRQVDLLVASVREVSEFSLGHDRSQPVAILGVNSPALEWALRNHSVQVVTALDPQLAPPLVITPVMDDLGLPSAYRGQDFVWREQPQWAILQFPDWLKWFVFRDLPVESETLLLWARDDLFPDARTNQQP